MNWQEYETFVDSLTGDAATDHALIAAHPLSDAAQLADLMSLCETEAEAAAVLAANPTLAQGVAAAEAAYDRLVRHERPSDSIYAAVRAAPDAVAAEAILAGASAEDYSQVAARLTVDAMSNEELWKTYTDLIAVGKGAE